MVNIQMIKNRMFSLKGSSMENIGLVVSNVKGLLIWHLRYGRLYSKRLVQGLPNILDIELCESCLFGKQATRSFPSDRAWRVSTSLELIHADLRGPMKTKSLGGRNFLLLFTDDFSRMS